MAPKTGTRLIDKVEGRRTVPMRVLLLGMPRTATLALYDAMKQLGYTPYHTMEAYMNPQRDFLLWEEALRAKFLGEGKPYGREEFDKLLGNFDSCSDAPCVLFIDELVAAYPDAKIVLGTRDPDKWVKSMQKTVFEVFSWHSWAWISPYDPVFARPWYSFNKTLAVTWFGLPQTENLASINTKNLPQIARKLFLEHYEHVGRAARSDQILKFQPTDGWGPLCEFLDKPVPEGDYPFINDAEEYVRIHKYIWWLTLAKASTKTVLPVLVAVGGWYMWQAFQVAQYLPYIKTQK